jgi:hypothetical protein
MERLTLASDARGRQNEGRGVAWCSNDLRCRTHLATNVISYHASALAYLDLVDIPSGVSLHHGYGYPSTDSICPTSRHWTVARHRMYCTLLRVSNWCENQHMSVGGNLKRKYRPLPTLDYRYQGLFSTFYQHYLYAQELALLAAALLAAMFHSSPLAAATCIHHHSNCSSCLDV